MADRPTPREVAHPTPLTYLKVAAILGALTAVEVAVFYVDVLEPAFLPIFLILSVAKFTLVVMFYMHLKFDSRLFSGVFVGGLLLAVVVAMTIMALFQVLSAVANPSDGGEPPAVHGQSPTPTPTPLPTGTPNPPTTPSPGVTVAPTTPPLPTTIPLTGAGKGIFLNVPENLGPQAPGPLGLWCYQCHLIKGIPGATGVIGPELSHIGSDAATRKPGLSAEEYIRESIQDPEAFVAEGVPRSLPGLMTKAITAGLTDEQVDALVTFLLEQK